VARDNEQAGHAQQTPTLAQARTGAVAVRLGRWMYLLGGTQAGTPLASIERALINGDGSLAPFQNAGSLGVGRAFASAIRTFFVIGGATGGGNVPVASIEQAPIGSDGGIHGIWKH
jgi:hypothetical protein